MIDRTVMVALTFSGWLLAQQPVAPAQVPDHPKDAAAPATTNTNTSATSGPASPQWRGLSVKEKLRYDARHLFDLDNLVFAGLGAAFDQLRDRPGAWGQGGGAFAERYASHVGQYIIQRSIMAPVQAIDHEDTRYFPSARTTFQGRLGDAFLHTIWRHNDTGGRMPAYSEFLGDYGAAALSRLWWPAKYHKGSAIFVAGSDTVLIDAGINVFHEFTPDIKRWLHLGH